MCCSPGRWGLRTIAFASLVPPPAGQVVLLDLHLVDSFEPVLRVELGLGSGGTFSLELSLAGTLLLVGTLGLQGTLASSSFSFASISS